MRRSVIAVSVIMIALNSTACTEKSTTYNINAKHEHPKPEEVMAKLDANNDKKISKEEAKGPLKEDFAKLDKDSDGFITLEELKKAPKPENNMKERPKPEDIMTKLDTNNDNKISKEEAKGPLGEEFKEVDTDKNGFITLEELNNAPKPKKKK